MGNNTDKAVRSIWIALLLILTLVAGSVSANSLGLAQQATPTGQITPTLGTTPGQEGTGTPGQTPGAPGTPQVTPGVTSTPGPDAQLTPGAGEGLVPVTGYEPAGYSVGVAMQPGINDLPVDLEIALVQVADGFQDPVNVVASPDGTGRLFVVERGGAVRIVNPDGTVEEEPFIDLTDITLSAFLEAGLYDIEFHPNFASNGRVYVHFAELMRNGDGMIVEYQVMAGNPNQLDPATARVIMQIEQPWANHNGGELAFGPDGYLYIGSGDGGWEGDPLEAGQDLSTLLGKLLRIDVDTTNGLQAYGIPEDNPFVRPPELVQLFGVTEEEFSQIHTEVRPEIWAYGLRNPWKFQFDPQTGDLYLPDVGQNHWEEINFQPADSTGGENYGWDRLMGTRCFPVELASCDPIGVLPVAEYSHDLGIAVVGIGVYRGSQFPIMDGIYFVGDWGSGRIWGLTQLDTGEWAFEELLDTDLHITGSGQAADGTLYVTSSTGQYEDTDVTQITGALWRLVPADQAPEEGTVITAEGGIPVTGGDIIRTEGTVREPIESVPIGLEVVAEGLTSPVYLTNAGDGSGRLFIVDQAGQIRVVDENGELLEEPFLDLTDRMVEFREGFDERGLLGLAFHPDYAENGRFFVYYSAPLREEAPDDWNHTAHISEFRVSAEDPNIADPDSEIILLQVDEPQFNHDGGTVAFGPDGYLYISFGDGGGADDVALGHVEDWYDVNEGGNGQDIEDNLLGNILRIDVDSGDPYGIPPDNPFVGMDGMDEIYAFGFRNPYRFSFDRGGTNQLFVADVGQNNFEEVNIVEPGGNYGWNVMEGTHCFSTENPDLPLDECPTEDPMGRPLILPVIEYLNANHEGGLGISVTGGFVYRGTAIPDLVGSYIFGDWSLSFEEPSGRLFMSEPQTGEGLWPIVELIPEGMEFNYHVLGFGEDEDGELYVTTSQSASPTGNTGVVFRLVAPTGAVPSPGVTPTPGGVTPMPGGAGTGTPTPTSQAGQPGGDQLISLGEDIYMANCAVCHGRTGTGLMGPALAGSSLVTMDDPTGVILQVYHGGGAMPAFGDSLSTEEIAAVVSFIRNSWGNMASIVTAEEVTEAVGGP